MAKHKYIRQDAAIDAVDVCNLHRGIIDALQAIISDIPSADVVEVVRCRDCKHRPVVTDESHPYGFGLACPKEGAYQDVTCPYLCDDGYYNRMPADGWYCADGERRADNG